MQTEITGNNQSLSFPKQQPFVVHLPVSRKLPANPSRRKPGKARTQLCEAHFFEPTGFNVMGELLDEFIGPIPATKELPNEDPARRARVIITAAAIRAAALSGGLALPPGPLGMLTILPDLLGIWKIHNQMVADIAGAYGKQARLSQEQLVRCLFKHGVCQLARDVIVRLGERAWVRRASLGLLLRIGVPILGAAVVAAYAYFDTVWVGRRAVNLLTQGSKQGRKAKPRRGRKPAAVAVNGAYGRPSSRPRRS